MKDGLLIAWFVASLLVPFVLLPAVIWIILLLRRCKKLLAEEVKLLTLLTHMLMTPKWDTPPQEEIKLLTEQKGRGRHGPRSTEERLQQSEAKKASNARKKAEAELAAAQKVMDSFSQES